MGDAVPELWVDRPISSQSKDAVLLGVKGEQNEVLQFLLGKTRTIRSDDSSSFTSASSSHSLQASELSFEDDIETTDSMGNRQSYINEGQRKGPQLEPMLATESDDDTIKAGWPDPQTEIQAGVDNLTKSLARNCFPGIQKSHSKSQLPRSRSDASQPEDEDASTNTVRRRKILFTSPQQHEPRPCERPNDGVTEIPGIEPKEERSSQSDVILIITVFFILSGYCVAIIYRFYHPISYPIPDVDSLFEPWDVSNVSVRFVSPSDHEETSAALSIEWEIGNFPADALRKHGPEPFEYRLLLDGRQILFDIGYWSVESGNEVLINKKIHYRLRPRDVPGFGRHILRVDVTFSVPGSDDELRTITHERAFIFSPPQSLKPSLKIVSPSEGSTVLGSSVVIEYTAHNVQTLDVVLDRKWRLTKIHITDGNLLFRGLGAGMHTIELEAVSEDGSLAATRHIYVEEPEVRIGVD